MKSPLFNRGMIAAFCFVVSSCTLCPLFALEGLDGRELPLLNRNGHASASGMFERAVPPRPCPQAPSSPGRLQSSLATPAPFLASPIARAIDPRRGGGPGAALLLYSCKGKPTNHCYWMCDSECHVDQDENIDASSCDNNTGLGCPFAGDCLLTVTIRCCTNCTYTCGSGCNFCSQCEGCPAPLRCPTQR
jgi:hypothetical protein